MIKTQNAKNKINPLLELARLAKKDKIKGPKTNISGNIDKYLPLNFR